MKNIRFVQRDFSLMKDAQKLGRELAPADVVILTHGVIAPSTRETTAEGIEKDMAVSTLSRLVVLRELIPRLSTARVIVYGMPGASRCACRVPLLIPHVFCRQRDEV